MRRRHRLSGRRQFAAVRAGRISASGGGLRVGLAANRHGHVRAGFVIPKAVGGAVVRNRVRRRLRAALEPHRERLAGFDVVISVAPAAVAADFARLSADLDRCVTLALAQARGRRSGAGRPQLADNGAHQPGPRRVLAPTSV